MKKIWLYYDFKLPGMNNILAAPNHATLKG